MDSRYFIDLETQFSAPVYDSLDVVLCRGDGIWVWDVEGRKYLDCIAGYSAVNQGHCHPKIMKALVEQAQKLSITSRSFRNDQLPTFLKAVCELTGYEQAIPMNSGSESVETAIKTVRKWGYNIKGVSADQAEIIVCENNYHGRTTTIIGFSNQQAYRAHFGPFTPGFKQIPFGDVKALEDAITPHTVAFMVEAIQGEAGIILPSPGYLAEVKAVCTTHNVLLILDEIQTGLGRTGKLLAQEHDGIKADMTLIGKSLTGGFYSMSAVLSDASVMGVFKPGEHGSTYGGNPLACAIACKALSVLMEEKLIDNSARMGVYFLSGLKAIKSYHIKEVRGKGLMIAIEILSENGNARRFCEELKTKGLLCMPAREDVIRITPPLVITQHEIDWALEKIRMVMC